MQASRSSRPLTYSCMRTAEEQKRRVILLVMHHAGTLTRTPSRSSVLRGGFDTESHGRHEAQYALMQDVPRVGGGQSDDEVALFATHLRNDIRPADREREKEREGQVRGPAGCA